MEAVAGRFEGFLATEWNGNKEGIPLECDVVVLGDCQY
jgi:hypothetical protein